MVTYQTASGSLVGKAKPTDKIQDLAKLATVLDAHKRSGQQVAHCHGVFDLLHIGHIRHFEEAKSKADILVVTLTSDRFVNKGPHRPAFSQALRAEAIAALSCVDYVAINDAPMAVELIKLLRPSYYVKGADYRNADDDVTGGITFEREAVESVGGQLMFTDDIVFSSSGLINRYIPALSKELTDYLAAFRTRHSGEDVARTIEQMKPLRVLAIGESIIDEYQYCQALGKSAKEPILAVKNLHKETFAGGAAAVANNAANFSDNVGILTLLGADSGAEFIREKLKKQMSFFPFVREKAPTIRKTRLIDSSSFTKLLSFYDIDESPLNESENSALCEILNEIVPQYDVIMVMDFGHSMISKQAADIICKKAPFLSINTQSNAGNFGFQNIYKYSRADYICITESEARIEMRDRDAQIHELITKLSSDLNCPTVTVTRGMHGSISLGEGNAIHEAPSLAGEVVDRMGAGDAFLSITSMAAAVKAPVEVLGLLGNAAAAQAVATVGHRDSINRATLTKFLTTLLK
jgi:rfaE bifunctional protein kinase chain/domain/rfaE bifunctional protein nucleotidyltransferase chain/domain